MADDDTELVGQRIRKRRIELNISQEELANMVGYTSKTTINKTEQLASTGEFFGLRIQGDSMAPRICDGDVVIVRQQSDAETGDIVIVRVDHERATCKRLRKYADGAVELISLNPSYEPMFFAKEELDDDYVVIVGVVVELRGKL